MALFCTSVLGSAATRVAWQAANPAPGAPYVDELSAAPLACEEATRAAATVTATPAAAPTRSDMRADIWWALLTTLAGRGILRCGAAVSCLWTTNDGQFGHGLTSRD